MTPLHRVTIASRVFCIAAILGLGLLTRDPQTIVTLVIVSALATTAVYVSLATPLATAFVVTVEAAVTGLIIGLALPGGIMFLPYLVVLTLLAGISGGLAGVSGVIITQVLTIATVAGVWAPNLDRVDVTRTLSPWLLTSIGVGLLGAWLRSVGKVPQTSKANESYESAHRLLNQLRTVARRLPSGLDPGTIAGTIADDIEAALVPTQTAVFVRTEGGLLSPLVYRGEDAEQMLRPAPAMTLDCWTELRPVVVRHAELGELPVTAIPLTVGSRMIGLVLTRGGTAHDAQTLQPLMPVLDDHSLRLDTAMAFDEIRSIATVEERRRLAREIHDGIAQEVASLGYAVDELLAGSSSPEQRADLSALRRDVTGLVSELRLSIFDLRSEVPNETGLGSALSDYVRQVGSRSTMKVHLSLDEGPLRLRAEIEAEMLRIAQEAITNARKHSRAQNLWVNCSVHPPLTQIEIRDDGIGLAGGRADSYGLRIMRERAERIGGRLEIHTVTDMSPATGTLVRVTLGFESATSVHTESEPSDDAARADHRLAGRRP